MASAVQMGGTERAAASSVRFSVQCFLPECYARLSRLEGFAMITSVTKNVYYRPASCGRTYVRRRKT
jgi:hypothetical protein